MFVPWAQEAAENLHIDSHLFYVSAADALSLDLVSRRLVHGGRLPITREARDMVFSDIPPTRALDLPGPYLNPPMFEWMEKYHLKFLHATVILVNTFYDIEKPVLDALRNQVIGSPDIQARHVLDIGPLLPESFVNDEAMQEESEERDPCILWLNKKAAHSVLYISFGSFATRLAPQLLELAMGLEASGCSFLWLVRPPDAPGMSAASGSPQPVTEFLPPGFEERTKGRGMCYSGWAPQKRILKHPAVGGFLSHCGWNSTLETVHWRAPMLAWPLTAEQHLNRRFLVDTVKVAIESKEELEGDVVRPAQFVSKDEIEKKVRCRRKIRSAEHAESEGQVSGSGSTGRILMEKFEAYVRLLHRDVH